MRDRLFDEAAWSELQAARSTELFETPVAHFLVRAFLADGMDEVMSHMTAIEAAVGRESDHRKWKLPKTTPHRGLSATDKVSARVAGLLTDPTAVQAYRDLFELRSSYVHGRAGLAKISTSQKVGARRLARSVARALVTAARRLPCDRDQVLDELLNAGAGYL